jgi:hypothetical protein
MSWNLIYFLFCFWFSDLAARNCLIDELSFTLKLSDFGLTKELEGDNEEYELKHQKQIPVRWASVELLTKSMFDKLMLSKIFK